jgi:hypothetical protein
MKLRFDLKRLVIVVGIVLCAYIAFQLFYKNLALWPEYSFHSHIIWAASEGHLVKDPFLCGGNYLTLNYGTPMVLFGALLHPLFGVYTVALLMVAAMPVFWYFSKRVFECFVNSRVALLAATAALLNPFTMYIFFVGKLPTLWSLCFGVMSIYCYLHRKWLFAAALGVLALLTHPLVIFLLGFAFFLNWDWEGWVKSYLPASAIFVAILLVLIKPGPERGIHITNIIFISGALLAALVLTRKYPLICGLGLLFLAGSVIGNFVEVPAQTVTFDRMGFFALLLVIPFLVKRYSLTAPLFVLLAAGCASPLAYVPRPDDPAAYRGFSDNAELVDTLRQGYVRYASDGSALYELPKLGIRFSNAGRKAPEQRLDAAAYAEKIKAENAWYVLVYTGDPVSFPEQEMINEIRKIDNRWQPIYKSNSIKIYKTHLAP